MRAQWICDLTSNAEKPFWQSELATRTLYLESFLASECLTRIHGETLLWIGHSKRATQVLSPRKMPGTFFVTPSLPDIEVAATTEPAQGADIAVATGEAAREIPTVVTLLDDLPFQSRSIDVIVIHHALEQASDPRTVLREASRVLAPGGKLIVIGFNPWSLIGLRRGFAAIVPDQLRQVRMVNPIRLFDWLTLLGLELDAPPAYGGLTLLRDRQYRRSIVPSPSQLPFGGIVVTSSVKKQASMHFQWQSQQPRPKLAPVAYPRIASWQENRGKDPQT